MATKQQSLDAALAQIDRAFGKNRTEEMPAPPSSMTERIARALCRQAILRQNDGEYRDDWAQKVDLSWSGHIADARDIIESMGSPTEEMLDDAEGWQSRDQYEDLETAREQIAFLWNAMLDCAECEYDDDGNSRAEMRENEAAAWNALSKEVQEAHWAEWNAKHFPNVAPF